MRNKQLQKADLSSGAVCVHGFFAWMFPFISVAGISCGNESISIPIVELIDNHHIATHTILPRIYKDASSGKGMEALGLRREAGPIVSPIPASDSDNGLAQGTQRLLVLLNNNESIPQTASPQADDDIAEPAKQVQPEGDPDAEPAPATSLEPVLEASEPPGI